ncbi:MAG: hypothetical protein LC744_06985 [Chloroflexi bacterium]|nr:hypothetical protein [Chloroflexota bacterium]
MTQYPRRLARELDLAYASIGLVTDDDAGVTQEEVFEAFARHLPRLRAAVLAAATQPQPA